MECWVLEGWSVGVLEGCGVLEGWRALANRFSGGVKPLLFTAYFLVVATLQKAGCGGRGVVWGGGAVRAGGIRV